MKRRSHCVGLLGVWLALLGIAPAGAQMPSPTLHVGGPVAAAPLQSSVDDLRKQFAGSIQTVNFTMHGQPHIATAIPLLTVLQVAGVPTGMQPAPGSDPHQKHRPMRIVVEASADDGYAVVFSLAELLPDVGHASVWLALDEDGAPLPTRDSPVDLIVPGDTKPARWVHGVTHLTASDYAPPATQP